MPKAHCWRNGENSAAWRGHLSHLLPKRQTLSKPHHPALPYRDVPAFLTTVRESQGIAAMALEFTILTAVRAGETLGATWDEIDLESRVWTIPARRTKTGLPHRVPLSVRAIDILKSMAAIRQNDFVFAGIGDHAMRKLCPKGVSVHGMRSSFRDWAGEETPFPREICEAALAHATGNAVEQAYRRGDALEKRRGLMETWAHYCTHVVAFTERFMARA
jgi:integrase